MTIKYLFSVDQSIACTGYCISSIEDESLIDFGCIKSSKADGDLFKRCNLMAQGLADALYNQGIIWEEVEFVREGLGFGGSNSNASRDLAYLVGVLERNFNTPFREVAPTRLKKFATGSGKADKQGMIDALPPIVLGWMKDKGYKKTTGLSDLADAYFIGQYFLTLPRLKDMLKPL